MSPLNRIFDDLFAAVPIMAILRGYSPKRTLELAHTAWDLGIECLEVPIQDVQAIKALEAVAKEGQSRGKAVGAGTVVSVENVQEAFDAGAAFTVSPGLDPDVVAASWTTGMATLPGVATASEIQLSFRLGLRWVKAFPAVGLGPAWFKAMQGPFPDMKFVATGGVNAETAAAFLKSGASVVSIGSALCDPEQLPALVTLLDPRSRVSALRFQCP